MLRFKTPNRQEAGGSRPPSIRHLCFRAVVLVGALVSAHQAFAAEKLVFGNPNPRGLNIGMAPFFYAMELGYFDKEGIELEFVNFDGGAVLDPQIATKAVDIGWPGPDSLVISHQQGKDPLPYKYFYNHLRRYVWEIVVPEASPIETIGDLKGAKIGVNSLTTTNIPTTKSIIASAGLDPEQDVSYVPVGMGGSAFNAIRTDQVDALNLFDTMHAILENTGFEIRRLDFPEKYYELFENGFAAHVDTLRDKRQALTGFGRAIAKATVGCYANLEACVRIAWKQDPALKPKQGSDADNMQDAVNILKTRGASYWDFDKQPHEPWGSFTDEMWRNRIEILHETGVINTKDIDPQKLYTDELLAGINDFDAEAVEREAKALK